MTEPENESSTRHPSLRISGVKSQSRRNALVAAILVIGLVGCVFVLLSGIENPGPIILTQFLLAVIAASLLATLGA